MKVRGKPYVLLAVLAALLACSDDDPVGPGDDFFYPLKLNSRWEYTREFSQFNFRPDTAGASFTDTLIVSTVSMEVVRKDTLPGSVAVYVLREELTEGDRPLQRSESYYENREDGLYFHAYKGPGHVIPKRARASRILFRGGYFQNIQEITRSLEVAIAVSQGISDSLIFEDPPLLSLKYPLEKGSQWNFRPPGRPWRIDKKVVAEEKIRVPAGEFGCYKIQWLYDMDRNGEWDSDIEFFDYVSSQGLVRRDILFRDLVWVGPESPEPLGKFDARDEAKLTRLQLN